MRQAAREQKRQKGFVPEQVAGANGWHRIHASAVAERRSIVNRASWRRHCAGKRAAAIIASGRVLEMMLQLQSAFGVLALLAIAWVFGENRRAVSVRQLIVGLAATVVTALVLIKVPPVAKAFGLINHAVDTIGAASRAGTSLRVRLSRRRRRCPSNSRAPGADFVLAFQALPIVLADERADDPAVLLARVCRRSCAACAWALERTLGVGGAVGLSTAANIFRRHGGSAPVHPPLSRHSSPAANCFVVMTGGMAGHRRHRARALRTRCFTP